MSNGSELLTTNRKALSINLDEQKYGTFAEIGAGQEVSRLFFQAGGAAGTIAKSMSAYDMTFSDEIYGKAPRYVSRERLVTMLDHEYSLLHERLSAQRGNKTTFFVFADTVAAKAYRGNNECHGWMGIRFQAEPNSEPSDIIIHVRMWDKDNLLQQQALGIVGVNLIYGAFAYREEPAKLISSLTDNVGNDRIEVDMLKLSGPAFEDVDNRLMSLHLVQFGLTNAVLFGPQQEVLQPSEVLRRKAIMVERGSFRPVTHVNVDMLNCACAQFMQEPAVQGKDLIVLMEITMNNLLASGDIDAEDFLARVDVLGDIGMTVLISNYPEYYRLTSYFRRYTSEMIGVAMGINNLLEIFNEKYYESLQGGILEAFGRLFRNAVKLYVYPMRRNAYDNYVQEIKAATGSVAAASAPIPALASHAFAADVLVTARNLQVSPHLRNLYAHLMENHYIDCTVGYNNDILDIFSRDVLRRLQGGDPSWENMVPAPVAQAIKSKGLFGYVAADETEPATDA
ncbi:TonB-dependent receptor [Actomonas aquatica]|uniref:TonB-dependent receptor n=1 Tax=Actomonas aquatica TaxID=2866162 RepID=A0ABZ1C8R4_9BACT|nr:TonB-dependent receptor [Opitutus sp. WL0086]WRQ88094.1 TonB-dependent receptor [Opitutus sp. WL0086]